MTISAYRSVAALAVVALGAAMCLASDDQSPADNGVVAKVGSRSIRYEEIRCGVSSPRREAAEQCRLAEQRKLDAILIAALLNAACEKQGIRVTDAEVTAATPKQSRLSDDDWRAGAERMQLIGRAVVKVHEGEARDTVFQRDLAPHGVTREQFDAALRYYPTIEAARRLATNDPTATWKAQNLAQHRRELQIKRLRDAIQQQATTNGEVYDRANERFWRDVIREMNAVVSDARYKLPDMEMLTL